MRSGGGKCSQCGRVVTAEQLRHDSALAITVNKVHSTRCDPDQATDTDVETAAADQLIGRRLGHFEIVESLGRGGMGHVFRALDHSLKRDVAVKILRRGTCQNDERQIESLLQEAIAQARVNHPNVATIYYVGREGADPFLAMELIEGGTLAARINNGPLPFSEIAPIAIQIVKALKISHQLDLIHGDLKPTNLLIMPSGEVKLSDYGMARSASATDSESGFGGTPNYLAPELLLGQSPSIQSDMYALGVTLYEMMFGRLPVELSGSTIPQWIDSHEHAKIVFPEPWPEYIPRGWRDFLQRLLSREPARRFANYDEILDVLQSLEPTRSPAARRLPRITAGLVDYTLVFLLFLIALVPLSILASVEGFVLSHWLLRSALALLGILPILGYTLVIALWRQSFGHALMHLRVVNRYGLPPPTRTLVMRSVCRMLPLWEMALVNMIGGQAEIWAWITISFMAVAWLWFMVDLATLLMLGRGHSLHDLLVRTRVVLGSD